MLCKLRAITTGRARLQGELHVCSVVAPVLSQSIACCLGFTRDCVSSDEVQKYLLSHTEQRPTLKITIGWLVLAVYLDGLKRRLVVNIFKLHH